VYKKWLTGPIAVGLIALAPQAQSALITFDDVVVGETTFGFDGDGDAIADVVFSTSDPLGFNTVGPGVNQQFIDEPGLEGTSLLDPDLRVDFLNGAVGPLEFGFALNSSFDSDDLFAAISVFDSAGGLLGSALTVGVLGDSSFPEGIVSVTFDGTASFATFDFTSEFGRYIIDNFSGTFGSTEEIPDPDPQPVPEPGTLLLLAMGLAGLRLARRR
jgi:hypothetical protein